MITIKTCAKYIVTLTDEEQEELTGLISVGKGAARRLAHARILLKADQSPGGPGWHDDVIATAVEMSRPTVERVRQRFVEEGLEAALAPRPSSPRPSRRTFDGARRELRGRIRCGGIRDDRR